MFYCIRCTRNTQKTFLAYQTSARRVLSKIVRICNQYITQGTCGSLVWSLCSSLYWMNSRERFAFWRKDDMPAHLRFISVVLWPENTSPAFRLFIFLISSLFDYYSVLYLFAYLASYIFMNSVFYFWNVLSVQKQPSSSIFHISMLYCTLRSVQYSAYSTTGMLYSSHMRDETYRYRYTSVLFLMQWWQWFFPLAQLYRRWSSLYYRNEVMIGRVL